MRSTILALLVILVLAIAGYVFLGDPEDATAPADDTQDALEDEQMDDDSSENTPMTHDSLIDPISHATAVLTWGDAVLYTDPVGGGDAFSGKAAPDVILVTDIHGDHLNVETLEAVSTPDTVIVAPQAVVDQFPDTIPGTVVVLANGETTSQAGFSIEAIPMYNLPESDDAYHTKGRGNGYVVEKDGMRVYISGDTAGIPEMRALENIDVALVAMNLPYTMSVEDAADAVLEFAPKNVYPYHYRGTDGLSDVGKFKQLVDAGGKDIEVVQLDWYEQK